MAIPIQRVVHVNVNCSDLERSLRFYRDPDGTCLELIESPKLENRDAPDRARTR